MCHAPAVEERRENDKDRPENKVFCDLKVHEGPRHRTRCDDGQRRRKRLEQVVRVPVREIESGSKRVVSECDDGQRRRKHLE
jgi:hypothetical protein